MAQSSIPERACGTCGVLFRPKNWVRHGTFCSVACYSATGHRRRPLAERLASKVTKPDGEGGCWLWTGVKIHNGYGQVHRRSWHGPMLAHRAMWEVTHGPIPDGLFVCHHCDVRACVNPAHLFLGTREDNTADMMRKGRQARGPRVREGR